jgi:hypothetical protein
MRIDQGIEHTRTEVMKLTKNIGHADRIVRLLIAVALGAAVVGGVVAAPLTYVAIVLAAMMVVTAVVEFCPLYALFGLRSRTATRA